MAGQFRYDLIPAGSTVLCALSGGADSMYLLCRLLEGARAGGYAVKAAHFNHNLRPTACRDEQFVRDWCAAKGVPLTVGAGDVAGEARARGMGLEECARALRYAFLERAAAEGGCARIATGHHAGDNAETVLMNLVRGCGLNGLCGIPERRGDLIRPMLSVERGEILAYLTARGVPHVEDESNGDLSYTRNRVRHRFLPLLEELNPRATAHIAETARRLREDEAELSRAAREVLRTCRETGRGVRIPADTLSGACRPVAVRAAALLLDRAGLGGGAAHREALLALAAGGGPSAQIDLPGGVARREYGVLVIERAGGDAPLTERPLREGENRWGDWRIRCTPAVCPDAPGTPESFYLAQGDYVIRPRREGDGLRPPNRVYKTLKKWMIEQKVPMRLRDRVPVLSLGGRAVAAGGVGVDAAALAAPGGPALHIIMSDTAKERDT